MPNVSSDAIRVRVDQTNPGQFFACCGLLELADRLWRGAEGWFEESVFCLRGQRQPGDPDQALASLVRTVVGTSLLAVDAEDETASPIQMGSPFDLRLDWWVDRRSGGDRLKVWAGSMRGVRIAQAMQRAIAGRMSRLGSMFDDGLVVHDPDDSTKKVEPFYFDARRGSNARSLDIGFAPDAFGMTTIAYPQVELFCLIGIQRVRPAPAEGRRTFAYHTWAEPLSPLAAACAACGAMPSATGRGYRFEVGFRTDQRKHKAFMPANAIREEMI